MQAVVLAAGRGVRLGRLTARRSKAMLPVAGQPLAGRVLERLWEAGLRRVVVVGGADDRELADYCTSRNPASRNPASRISYVVQHERRGMAHALACAAPLIDAPFLLCACDNLVASTFITALMVHLEETGADGVLALLRMSPERLQYSAAVELAADGRARRIVEKPPPGSTQSDAGSIALYAFRPRLLDYLDVPLSPRGEQELQSAVQALMDAGGDVHGLFAPGRQTVTCPADLLALNLYYLDQGIGAEVQASLPGDVRVTPPVRIEAGVELGAGCAIGPRVYLETGCRVGQGVRLRDALVLRGGVVPAGVEVTGAIWADAGVDQSV
jgi:NDP-sugar pyrophosphorylase family protein